jgi:hypothetical protein
MHLARRQCPTQIELALDALNTMRAIDVLHERNLIAGSGTLSRNDGGVGEEVFPDLVYYVSDGVKVERRGIYSEPPIPVFGSNFVTIGHPVPIPAP